MATEGDYGGRNSSMTARRAADRTRAAEHDQLDPEAPITNEPAVEVGGDAAELMAVSSSLGAAGCIGDRGAAADMAG